MNIIRSSCIPALSSHVPQLPNQIIACATKFSRTDEDHVLFRHQWQSILETRQRKRYNTFSYIMMLKLRGLMLILLFISGITSDKVKCCFERFWNVLRKVYHLQHISITLQKCSSWCNERFCKIKSVCRPYNRTAKITSTDIYIHEGITLNSPIYVQVRKSFTEMSLMNQNF